VEGATNAALTLTNAQPAQTGAYQVRVSNEQGVQLSQVAMVIVASRPVIVEQPRGAVVLAGETVRLSVTASGSPPLGFRWRLNGTTRFHEVLDTNTSWLVLTNVPPAQGGIYTVVVTNFSGFQTLSSNAVLTVLADHDRDGMADVWEAQHGFDTNLASDAVLDVDGDGMSNRAEYVAGTEPTNALSRLRLEVSPPSHGLMRLQFFAVSNKTYSLQTSPTLSALAWPAATNLPAQGSNQWQTLIVPATNPGANFYRLSTPAEPLR
jgi:hypothetical protein